MGYPSVWVELVMSSCEPGRRCCDVPAFRMSRECQSNDVAAKLEVATSLGLLEGGLGIYLIGGVLVINYS